MSELPSDFTGGCVPGDVKVDRTTSTRSSTYDVSTIHQYPRFPGFQYYSFSRGFRVSASGSFPEKPDAYD